MCVCVLVSCENEAGAPKSSHFYENGGEGWGVGLE